MPHGILRNENEATPSSGPVFNRKQVFENTELNAKLGSEGIELRERLHKQPGSGPSNKTKYAKTKAPSALNLPKEDDDEEEDAVDEEDKNKDVNFNKQELAAWDEQRGQTEKIIEPNTPYMGTAADTEYYDEDPIDLDLGETVIDE
ncbi:hypothetical protein DASB73_022260 [Starmerella bacillaris]|uniref:Uncharacterized protein n=1 Tax=Starmerella bacillaris TaxID=1247836 RepID=A0AAV5RKK8_STABA|nr:hypothetical protein DASB73_022260 [Starmerella bacillaris]